MVDFSLLRKLTPQQREDARRKQEEREAFERKRFSDLLADMTTSAKLSEWEDDFVTSIAMKKDRGIFQMISDLSEKQQTILLRIESKIYQSG